jgi:hypothetical protein
MRVDGVGVSVVASAARLPRRASSFREAKTWLAPSRRRIVYHDIRRAPAADEQRQAALAISTTAKYRGHRRGAPMSRTGTTSNIKHEAALHKSSNGLAGGCSPSFPFPCSAGLKRGMTPVRPATVQHSGREAVDCMTSGRSKDSRRAAAMFSASIIMPKGRGGLQGSSTVCLAGKGRQSVRALASYNRL